MVQDNLFSFSTHPHPGKFILSNHTPSCPASQCGTPDNNGDGIVKPIVMINFENKLTLNSKLPQSLSKSQPIWWIFDVMAAATLPFPKPNLTLH